MQLYIGCGLTHVPRERFSEYTHFVHSLAAALSEGHCVKYALRDSDPQLGEREANERGRLCYLWDRQMVEHADAMVAEVSFPSTGLGIELQVAEARGIPLIACYRDWGTNRASPVTYETPDHASHQLQIGKGFVSLMVLGLPNIFETIEYADPLVGCEQVVAAVDRLKRV